MSIRTWLARLRGTGGTRYLLLAVVLLALLGISRLAEGVIVARMEGEWEGIAGEKCAAGLESAALGFAEIQRSLRRLGTSVGTHAAVQEYLSGRSRDRARVFAGIASAASDQDVAVEVYDREDRLVAWKGGGATSVAADVRRALSGGMASYVARTPIYSQLLMILPVREAEKVIGAVVLRRSIESEAPLSGTLFGREGLEESLSRSIGLPVSFTFPGEGEADRDGRACSATLYGIDSTKLGTVHVTRPARSSSLIMVGERFQQANGILLLMLLSVCIAAAARGIARSPSLLLRLAFITIAVGSARACLVLTGVPSAFLSSGVFDPSVFASSFGWGIAQSEGETAITIGLLALYAVLVARELMRPRRRVEVEAWSPFLRYPLALLLSGLLYGMLRGYGVAIKSAVTDSTITYVDAQVILPGVPLALMVLNSFVLGACLLAAAVGAVLLIVRLSTSSGRGAVDGWLRGGALLLLGAAAFGVLEETPLMSTGYRLLFGVLTLVLAFRYAAAPTARRRRIRRRHLLALLAGSAVLLYPLLYTYTHDKDRERLEIFAAEELKPVDGWLKNVVEEGLRGFNADEYREPLSEGFAGDVAGIAFRRWAASLACRQGYDAIFSVLDPSGVEASRFVVGGSIAPMLEAERELPAAGGRDVRVRDIGTGVNALKVYSGAAPILAADSTILGYGRVIVAAGQQSLFRGDTPPLLRGSSATGIESFYRRITLSEYRDGELLTSNDPTIPLAHPLPEQVADAFSDSSRGSVWGTVQAGGVRYETYFVRRVAGSGDIVALGVREPGLAWHIVGIVKLFAAYILVALGILLVARLLPLRGRRPRLRFTFRDRLLAAMMITALLPLTIVAVYTRVSLREREEEGVQRRLEEETQNVLYMLTDHPEPGVTILSAPPDRFAAEQLAAEIETDFNLYTDGRLRVSSKQMLYDVGILDPRLSGTAFAKIILGGERFLTQTEKVGSIDYTVGYRPILDAMGNIIGVVSVPTLFRPQESEEQLANRNAFLLGAYALVLLATLVIAAGFANRIAAPVHRLTQATRRVARGDLDVRVPVSGAEGEIGELISAFDQMTDDLRKGRDESARFERELAWKEMAKQVAHEIKNPLTPMRLSVQHLRRTYLDHAPDFPEIMETVTRTVIEQIDALSRIASEFSHFGRMPRRSLEPQDVNGVAGEAAALFRQESRITIGQRFAPDLPPVLADRDELRRAVINIIRNGIQATEGEGRILLRTMRAKDGVLLEITDFGRGVPDDVKPRLFQPNFSTKTDGMGLGLAMVRKTVEDLGGRVGLESTEGMGTTVTIWIPAAATSGGGVS
jgi:two-component system, NtrC family, nitrogen regulation sensor histidine kinase NtrY